MHLRLSSAPQMQGYRPTERDRQALERQVARDAARRPGCSDHFANPEAAARLAVVAEVARARLADPAAQARVVARAPERLADWLDRGARLEPWPPALAPPYPDERRR